MNYLKTLFNIVALVLAVLFLNYATNSNEVISSFEGCVNAGFPVMESYPRQCRDSDGNNFVEDIGNEMSLLGDIRIIEPRPGADIESPLTILGEALGNWYFEGDMEVRLFDSNDNQIALHYVSSIGDSMKNEMVPFRGVLNFTTQGDQKESGKLVIYKQNIDDGLEGGTNESLVVPVNILPNTETEVSVCKPTGCSGQICSDEEVVTTCEYREVYACFEKAVCEIQLSGECGWTETDELLSCIADFN